MTTSMADNKCGRCGEPSDQYHLCESCYRENIIKQAKEEEREI